MKVTTFEIGRVNGFKAIQEYIHLNDSKVILLSATPFNKSYIDLSNQLSLFLPEEADWELHQSNLLRVLVVKYNL